MSVVQSSPQAPLASDNDEPNSDAYDFGVATSLVEGLADAAILLDRERRGVSASRPFLLLVGMRAKALSRAYARGKSLFDLFETLEIPRETLDTCISRGTRACLFDVRCSNHDGEEFVVIVTLIPVRDSDGTTYGVTCVLRDVTAEVGLQHNYKELHAAEQVRSEKLEDTVRRRTIDLQRALDAVTAQAAALKESNLRELALQKSVFAGRLATGLAHEFNSPLACVLANQSYLRSRMEGIAINIVGAPPEFAEFLEEAIEIIDEDSGSMKRLSATVSALLGSFCQTMDVSEAPGPALTDLGELLLDAQRALRGAGVAVGEVSFCNNEPGVILANVADVSLALVTLIQFLRNHEAAPENPDSSMAEKDDSSGSRHVAVSTAFDSLACIISLAAPQLHLNTDEAESAFDPSLVVGEDSRVKLSVDLSVCAARIARSGGSVQFTEDEMGGTIVEVHLVKASDEETELDTTSAA
ncbi:MAG: PAS domain-containing protein [Myxococcales bacterium]|nr:PAS domain-containing protein [Myxococcales bacterium]